MDSNQAFNQIVLFSGFEYHRALEYLKERGFFFCAKLEKNPKCPELWMATTHPLMIDWNKGNDGEYYSMFPKDFSHPEFDYYEQRCDQLSKLLQLIVSFFEISPNIYWAKSEEEILNILNKVKK